MASRRPPAAFLGKPLALGLALVVTCVFGRMAFLARSGAFEYASPTRFEQLDALWGVLYWTVPALLVALAFPRRTAAAACAAAAVSLGGELFGLAIGYRHIVPTGAALPDRQTLLFVMAEVEEAVAVATLTAVVVQVAIRRVLYRNEL